MAHTVKLKVIIIFFLAAYPGGLFAQEPWRTVSSDNGVALFSRKEAGHHESVFKGITDINQPLEVIGAVLAEIPAYTRWFFNCMQDITKLLGI